MNSQSATAAEGRAINELQYCFKHGWKMYTYYTGSMFVPLSTNAGGKRHLRRRYSTESRMKRQSKIVCILVTEEEEEIANSIRVYYVKTNDVPKDNIDRQNLRLGKTVLKTRGK